LPLISQTFSHALRRVVSCCVSCCVSCRAVVSCRVVGRVI
jgi:hypothetical protein